MAKKSTQPTDLERRLTEKEAEISRYKHELAIEAALDKVRSRAMMMHKSDELRQVIATIFDQLQQLGFDSSASLLAIYNDDFSSEHWIAGLTHDQLPTSYHVPACDHPYYTEEFEAWKQGLPFKELIFEGEQKVEYARIMLEISDYKLLPEEFKKEMLSPERLYISNAHMKYGLMEVWGDQRLDPPSIDILKRFAKVFEQSYTRFLDLEKAEKQAREAQIEAALERVRAAAMAMNNSSELENVVKIIREQMALLGQAQLETIAVHLYPEKGDKFQSYYAIRSPHRKKGKVLSGTTWFSKSDTAIARKMLALYHSESVEYELENQGKVLDEWQDMVLEYIPGMKEEWDGHIPVYQYWYFADFSGGTFVLIPREEPNEEAKSLLRRIASVFDIAYLRYLDLQKAEAQAKEAKIEAALERVRSASMAMHESNELHTVITILANQLSALGIEMDSCQIEEKSDDSRDQNFWLAIAPTSEAGYTIVRRIFIPFKDIKWFTAIEEARNKGKSGLTDTFSKSEKDAFFNHYFKTSSHKNVPEERKTYILSTEGMTRAAVLTHRSMVSILRYNSHPFSREEYDILKRFAAVFEQSYTRFLDLKKAEAQAREAQIEAALERVRASTMAMHRSTELPDTAQVMFEQFITLGSEPWVFAFCIFRDGSHMADNWACSRVGPMSPMEIPHNEDSVFINIYNAWKEKKPLHIEEVHGQRLVDHFEYVKGIQSIGQSIEEMSDHGIDLPEHIFFNCANFKYGYVMFGTYDNRKENHDIFLRFSKVFEQTYTRFLDLQSAEERAREAEIEASLERIRSRAMAMHRTDELNEVVGVIFEELRQIGFDNTLCSIGIYDEETKGADWWTYIENKELPGSYHFPYLEGRWFKEVYEAWVTKKPYHYIELHGDDLKLQEKLTFEYTEWSLLPDEVKEAMLEISSESIKACYISMNCGMLEVVIDSPLNEDQIRLLQRFTSVIDFTYTRVDDLEQAEARTREAVQQASLDRIRAEIASMRTARDLEIITPLIWRELTTLEVPFFRCGVFIVEEEAEQVKSYLSTPSGESLAAMEVNFGELDLIDQTVAHWKKQEVYRDHWDRQQFIDFTRNMMDRGLIDDKVKYQGAIEAPESLHLQLAPFKQGMLYVGSAEPLEDNQIALIQELANAFSVAYARYEDFNQLEAAKKEVESALSDLKATQAQLVQSEKMASLGELTAGIAHEIQNPLNFVNNFSDVSTEMIDESIEELENQDLSEVKEILTDLKGNLEKIHHHGARASSIVKGMLEHSRASSNERTEVDINAMCDEYLRLAYHGLRAKDRTFNATYETDFDHEVPKLKVVSQDIGRVLLNLINNAFQAVEEKYKSGIDGYSPQVFIKTQLSSSGGGKEEKSVQISVQDNGTGIPEKIRDKIFQPFFTTKPTGQGTGLGLSLSYDIIKAHGGEIKVESEVGWGTAFVLCLPVS